MLNTTNYVNPNTTTVDNFLEVLSSQGFSRHNSHQIGKLVYDFDGENYYIKPDVERAIREIQTLNDKTLIGLSNLLATPLTGLSSLRKECTAILAQVDHPVDKDGLSIAISILLSASRYGRWGEDAASGVINKFMKALVFKEEYVFAGEKLTDLLQRHIITNILLGYFLDNYSRIEGRGVRVSRYSMKLRNVIRDYCNSYNWSRLYNIDTQAECTEVAQGIDNRLVINLTPVDLEKLADADIDFGNLRLSGKKVIIGQIADIPVADIEKAAKKISTPIDISSVKAYTITEGLKLNNTRALSDYWHLMRISPEQAAKYTTDLKGAVCVVIETPQSKYTTCATSLGRALASASKKVQGAVMDSLDLSF